MKILVTGFEPNDSGLNASEIVVRSLQNELPLELRQHVGGFEFEILPGDTQRLGEVIEGTLEAIAPDIYIGIGQARGYNKITIERMAKNLRYFVTPDKAGNTPKGVPVVPRAPVAYWQSLSDIDSLIPLLESHNIPARVINDCGTHLCNQAFYHCLHWRALRKSATQVGFIHVPALPEQVIKHWPEAPFMPLEMTCKAIALIIKSQLRPIR